MIDVLKRLAELDATNPNVAKPAMTQEQSLATVSNIEGETITESVNECGPMGMPGQQNASFSINASAQSGDEVASMLTQIMNLAGVKPVSELPAFGGSAHKEIELEPAHSAEFEPSAGDEMAKAIGMIDRMNGPTENPGAKLGLSQDEEMGDSGSSSPVANMADEVEDMTAELADMNSESIGAGFDQATTTPDEKIEPHKYGNDQVTIGKKAEPEKKAGAGNPYTESVEQVSLQLLKAYEIFKNS